MVKLFDTFCKFKKRIFRKKKQSIQIVFLVHNITTLDCIIPLINEMQQDSRFEILAASLNRKFPGDETYLGEDAVHQELVRLGIHHIRLGMPDSMEGRNILKRLKPDIIFRQSPWDDDIQEGYRTRNLGFSRLCYTPYYGIHIVDNDEKDFLHYDQAFHRHCWKIFVDPVTAEEYRKSSKLHGSNVVVTGLTKYEYVWLCMQANSAAGDNQQSGKTIIWAPHHSVSKDWFNFATFHLIYQYLLMYVESHPQFHFIFRPHPAFYNNYIASGVLTKQELEAFYNRWRNLKNTSISENEDYGRLFVQSDALLTDGISFLASYQVTGKPLIWIRNKGHQRFTALGKKMIESVYMIEIDNISKIERLMKVLFSDDKKDTLKAKRKIFVEKYLLNEKEQPSKNIINHILSEFGFDNQIQ